MSGVNPDKTGSIAVVDYGMGNLASVRWALEECGAEVRVVRAPEEISGARGIVLPGVGSFGDGMKNLVSQGWPEALTDAVTARGLPLLGICLGMQMLADQGEEGGPCAGLGLIAGRVERLQPLNREERIPHVGWNELRPLNAACGLFTGIPEGADVYFVHSYRFVPENETHVAARTPYAGGFTSAVFRGPVFGVQFHPEKSGAAGLKILENFLGLL